MRTAVDTNVLVRFLTGDDETGQSTKARNLFERLNVVLIPSVLLEVEWVLRKTYRFDRSKVDAAFSVLLVMPNVEILGEQELIQALDGLRLGMDFADALHLAVSSDCDELVTFDRDFVRRAQAAPGAVPVRLL